MSLEECGSTRCTADLMGVDGVLHSRAHEEHFGCVFRGFAMWFYLDDGSSSVMVDNCCILVRSERGYISMPAFTAHPTIWNPLAASPAPLREVSFAQMVLWFLLTARYTTSSANNWLPLPTVVLFNAAWWCLMADNRMLVLYVKPGQLSMSYPRCCC